MTPAHPPPVPSWRDADPGAGHLGDRVHALLDGALSPEEAAIARAHLDACDACRFQHRRLSAAVGLVGALGPARAPEGFAARVLKRVRSQRRNSGLRPGPDQKLHYEGGIIILIVAASAALVVGWTVAHNAAPLVARFDAPAAAGK